MWDTFIQSNVGIRARLLYFNVVLSEVARRD